MIDFEYCSLKNEVKLKTDDGVEFVLKGFVGGKEFYVYIDGDEFKETSDTLRGLYIKIKGTILPLSHVAGEAIEALEEYINLGVIADEEESRHILSMSDPSRFINI